MHRYTAQQLNLSDIAEVVSDLLFYSVKDWLEYGFTGTTRKLPESGGVPKLVSIAAAAQRPVHRTTSFNEIIALARELPLLDSSEVDDASPAPTLDVIWELRDVGAEIDVYDEVYTAALPAPTPFFCARPRRLNKTLLNGAQRRARGASADLQTSNLQLRSQDPL